MGESKRKAKKAQVKYKKTNAQTYALCDSDEKNKDVPLKLRVTRNKSRSLEHAELSKMPIANEQLQSTQTLSIPNKRSKQNRYGNATRGKRSNTLGCAKGPLRAHPTVAVQAIA